jgi:hypothetical protein
MRRIFLRKKRRWHLMPARLVGGKDFGRRQEAAAPITGRRKFLAKLDRIGVNQRQFSMNNKNIFWLFLGIGIGILAMMWWMQQRAIAMALANHDMASVKPRWRDCDSSQTKKITNGDIGRQAEWAATRLIQIP